jgi:hypothetical protein
MVKWSSRYWPEHPAIFAFNGRPVDLFFQEVNQLVNCIIKTQMRVNYTVESGEIGNFGWQTLMSRQNKAILQDRNDVPARLYGMTDLFK